MKFRGYLRPDGSVGVRNHLLVIPTVACSYTIAQRIASQVPNAVFIPNQLGCAQTGRDLRQTLNTLIGYGLNGNVAAVLIVSLGCETLIDTDIVERISSSEKPAEWLSIQDCGGESATYRRGVEILRDMAKKVSRNRRRTLDLNRVIVGLECGGSDATSALASNPAVGVASDMIIESGGTSIISEIPEFIGAEDIFASRAVNNEVRKKVLKTVKKFERDLKKTGTDFRGAQPTPGNIEGGITTLEEKSLGAILKAGDSPVSGVLEYAERPENRGLYLMNTPGYDVESVTGMVAGGANIIIFTTGRGTPLGNPVAPVIKVTANSETYNRMKEHIDIDASKIVEGVERVEDLGKKILEKVLAVASGEYVKAEILGHREFAITRTGPTY